MAKAILTSTENGSDSMNDINNNFTEVYTGQHIHNATEKTTPVDADELGLVDSEDGDVLKKTTMADIKATGAEINTGTDDAKFATPKAIADSILKQYPEGAMLNGKIVPSVSSNNLTVALKTKAGANPSASDPVYVMIGGELRSITSVLSVTLNAGTNWFNAGSAELATREIDYFVYLGYNATDGVVIGIARIPYATHYGDFSTTNTNEKYRGFSNIANATSGDYYNVIGRFAATLSAGSGYTWSVPTFTADNLIQRPIYETRWLSSIITVDTSTADDGSGGQPGTRSMQYRLFNQELYGNIKLSGTKVGIGARIIVTSLAFSIGALIQPYVALGSVYNATRGQGGTVGWLVNRTSLELVFSNQQNDNDTFTGGASFIYIIV